MIYLHPRIKGFFMFLFLIFALLFSSCAKDQDLFAEAVEENIEQAEEDIINNSDNDETQGEDTSGSDENNGDREDTEGGSVVAIPDVNAPFTINPGNQIPLTPANPNRIIYIAVDGSSQSDGLSESNPKDIDSAFDKDFIRAGDVFYIKAGEYSYNGNPNGDGHYDMSNLPCSSSEPCYWIGYKDTPGDINASEYATVTWDDYKSRPRNSDGTHDLNATTMPTFSGNKGSGKYIDNESLFYSDGGEEGFVFRNMQIQYFRRGFEFRNLSSSVFENITQANHGWFTTVRGQGGSNSDLQGSAFMLHSPSKNSYGSNNVILNCAVYNVAFRAYTVGNGRSNTIAFSEAYSDIDNGNPQDYYFHTIGEGNLFTNLKAGRFINSSHSGHGICFNQLSKNNVMQHSEIYGTSVHFDGAIECYANEIEVIGDNSYGLFKGGDIAVFDNAEFNLIENSIVRGGDTGITFADSGKNPYPEHAGQHNTFNNVIIEDKLESIIELFWWDEVNDLTSHNEFIGCTFSNAPNLFKIERPNSDFSIMNSEIVNVNNLIIIDDRRGVFDLNSNTKFLNSNFWQSELPSGNEYVVEGLTQNAPK